MPFASIEDLIERFAAEGYLMDRSLATTVFLSRALEKPLFLEGEPGVGKTELAKVLARIFDAELIRLQCYEGLDTSSALYEWNYAKQMLEIRLEEARGVDKERIGANIFSEEFLLERPLLKAIQAPPPGRVVLLIDEVDRSDEEFEAFLLEVLSEFQISIPEIGTLRASQPPFVVLTSNRTRDLHDALKRRCLYHWIDYPDVDKEIGIVLAQVPGIDERLAGQLCRFMQWIRTQELYKLPGVAETVDWAKALISLEVTELDAETVDATLGCILKFKGDLDVMRQANITTSLPEALGTPPSTEQDPTLLRHLVNFGHHLREGGVIVNPARIADLCRALDHVDIGVHEDFRAAARATLVSNREDLASFERLFSEYWFPADDERETGPTPEHRQADEVAGGDPALLESGPDVALLGDDDGPAEPPDADAVNAISYSKHTALGQKDLGTLNEEEIIAARRLIQDLVRALMNRPGRRHRAANRGRMIDFRRSFRHNVAQGFEALELHYRRPRIKKLKLIVLCDVSGSMARYAGFLLDFIYALRHELPSTEAAVFSTHLTPITSYLRTRDIARSLQEVADQAAGWGGGTDIGRSLAEFNSRYSQAMLSSRAVVLILSDGWDRGDARTMRTEIAQLRRRAHRIIWLNPLLGGKDYQPLCRGIRAALPHLDHFLPAHNLASLADVAEVLRAA
jgi:uncharacterized protein with von Willebrand factor type A (vWA) domain/MoxR-like ATPase